MSNATQLIFGAGLIGNFLAGCCLSKGFDVTLLGRDNMQQKLQNGLIVSDYDGNKVSLDAPNFILAAQTTFDIIWLTVKCTATESSVAGLKQAVGPQTVIVCCQNGFGSDEIIRQAFPDNRILIGIFGPNVALTSTSNDTAHFSRATQGKFVVESHPQLDPILRLLDSPLLPAHSSNNIVAEQWAKLQLNLANPVNALADVPVKTMIETAGYRAIIVALMYELLSVTKTLGIELPKVSAVPGPWIPRIMSLPNWAFMRLAQKMLAVDPAAKTSMCWDLQAGRNTEIEYLNAALVRQATKLGIACPVNRKIVELVHQVEAKQAAIGFSADALQAKLL